MSNILELAVALGIPDVDRELFARALTHRSYAYEHGGLPHSERLEFLGDSVLGVVVSSKLFKLDLDANEGDLSRQRASVVSTEALASIAATYRIGDYLLLGKGEEHTGGRSKHSLLADATEAIIGATYVSLGMDAAWALVTRITQPLVDRLDSEDLSLGMDPKTALQELAAEQGIGAPVYTETATGPDHDRHFNAEVSIDGVMCGSGSGASKKAAQKIAARTAWRVLRGATTTE